MKFAKKLSAGVKKHLSYLKGLYDKRIELAESRARQQLGKAQTKVAREKVMLQLKRDKMTAKKELYEAQIATKRAKTALEKARKEAGDLTISERAMGIYQLFAGKPKRRGSRKGRAKPKSRRVHLKT